MKSSISRSAAWIFTTRKRTPTRSSTTRLSTLARRLVDSANEVPGYTVGEERQKLAGVRSRRA
jgi:hypothetical protein